MPRVPLTNIDLENYARHYEIPYFRGVYMINNLPRNPETNESAIVNLDDMDGRGTHWVAYKKRGYNVIYFDSIGNLPPPKEIIEYLGNCKIFYNYKQEQEPSTVICGHLCLKFLMNKTSR